MNNKLKLTLLLIIISLSFSQLNGKVLYDQKYLTVGVLSNEAIPQFTENQNIRFLGKYPSEDLLRNGGKLTLDKLFNLNNPSIQYLYDQGLRESTKEEYEIALKDISADPKTILQSEGAVQLIKNNYIIIFDTEIKKNLVHTGSNKTIWKYWKVYHVEIDDEIINQVFYNWDNKLKLQEINVPIKLVMSGKIKEENISDLVFKISKKIGPFAVRGPILSNHPTIASITSIQGVHQGDNVKVYQTTENNKGELSSKKIADAIVLSTNRQNSKLQIISGRYPSYKKGDIACLIGRIGQSVSIEGSYSFGNDWRAGGKFLYDIRATTTNKGVSWYFLTGLEINQFNKEPLKIWHSDNSLTSSSFQPSLRTYSFLIGAEMGYSFLTKFEILPYATLGFGISSLTKQGYMWIADNQSFEKSRIFCGLPLEGGIKLAYNICYPLQLLIGANYNYYIIFPQSIDDDLHRNQHWKNIVADRHNFNRLNFTVGLRYNF